VLALDDVSLQVAAGAVHAVVGENGAGKSTLMKILAGAISADAGIVEIDGRAVRITDARSAQRHGIAIVYQDFALVGDLSVSENVFLGRWPHSRRTGCIDFASLHRRAAELLSGLGIPLPVRRRAGDLSVAQQQMVEIAKALSFEARILILDEPSAALTPHELEALFRLVRGLKDRGVSVIYISHRLDEIFDVADTVTVLRDGRHISTRPIEAVQRSRLIAEMVGREMKDEFPSRACPLGEVVLAEVLALTGLVGSGRTSVGKTIFGAVRATDGKVMIGGQAHRLRSPREAIAAGIAMLPEDRKLEGLLLERNLRENTTLANRQAVASTGFLRIARERALTRRLMTDLQIKAVSTECIVATLSGGNQQKVLLARWMSRPHRVIIFDEPTRGVDVGAKYEIYTLINRLAADGMAVVMISSELPEVIGMADRIGIMHEGRLVSILDNGTRRVTQEQILRLAAGQEHVS
jgi:ribose transport system ATP-binding protein